MKREFYEKWQEGDMNAEFGHLIFRYLLYSFFKMGYTEAMNQAVSSLFNCAFEAFHCSATTSVSETTNLPISLTYIRQGTNTIETKSFATFATFATFFIIDVTPLPFFL